jgi:peptidoglycan/LPS O-acetylase OafA/YrhL
MENQKYAKIFKILLVVLLILSVGVLVWGFLTGFEANDGAATNVLLYWAYIVIGIALAAVICVGIYIRATTDPKSLVKLGIVVLGVAVLAGLVYLISPGNPAVGYSGATLPSASELKLTDTILNLAYIVGGCAILSIIVGEVVMAIRKK